jgi:aromatic-L-amino-acid decarboxylase
VRSRVAGMENVDSFVFNPHKWLFTNFDCSAFYMRDPSALTRALSLTPSYLESRASGQVPEYRDWSVALGRRFRALKLWFVLRSYGAEGLRRKIRDHIAWTERLAELVRCSSGFELTTEPRLALLTFRYAPESITTSSALDELNERLLKRINDGGRLYLTKTRARGDLVIRFVIGQSYTTWRHVEEGWDAIVETARAL